jgi:hypothetical protein
MIRTIAPDEMWSVFHDEWSGTFEWICGFARADELLNGGMTSINGVPCSVSVVDEWPAIRGVQVRASLAKDRAFKLRVAA